MQVYYARNGDLEAPRVISGEFLQEPLEQASERRTMATLAEQKKFCHVFMEFGAVVDLRELQQVALTKTLPTPLSLQTRLD